MLINHSKGAALARGVTLGERELLSAEAVPKGGCHCRTVWGQHSWQLGGAKSFLKEDLGNTVSTTVHPLRPSGLLHRCSGSSSSRIQWV